MCSVNPLNYTTSGDGLTQGFAVVVAALRVDLKSDFVPPLTHVAGCDDVFRHDVVTSDGALLGEVLIVNVACLPRRFE